MAGEALLGAAFRALLDRLISPELINFFRGRKHYERHLQKLKLKLLGLNKVLNDAEDKQLTDPAVKEWLDELKDAVYDAEDLVDEIATAALRCKVEAEYQSGPNTSGTVFNDEIESKLESMIDRLEDLTEEKDALGLREVAGRNWSQNRSPTSYFVDESCVYGREADREKIMKLLFSYGESSNRIDVIPIVGMGGVGKTTLAQLLYNDERVVKYFYKKAWVCVSNVFDVLSITRTTVEAVLGSASDAKDLHSLLVKLEESLCEQKFLIVFDDVWNENYDWDILMTPLRSFGARGSRIIVTMRNESVASIMQTIPIYGLHELPEEDCWKLFSKHAFEKGDYDAHPNLQKIGKEIVRKCKGLPLAAKRLGGLLRSKREVKDWNNILESAIWELSEEKCDILPTLRLSYHYLPSHLKRCFAYCSIFTKDYQFQIKELVSNWIAEGFVEKPKNNKTVEEEGYECFHELLSRSFFQRSNFDDSVFVMHDLVHDLAQSVVGEFCYRLEDGKPCSTSEKVRHFSYVRGRFDDFDKFKVIKDAKRLRTFLQTDRRTYGEQWLSKTVLDEILPGLTHLRLLSLPRYQIEELPYSIGNLIHLRFLDLSYTRINQLPKSVCTLYNLETLLLSNCHLLTTLPAELVKLISLRHLDLSGTNLKEMPMHISRLKDLQQLTAFVVGKCSGSGINELKELNSLRGTISISGLQNVKCGNEAFKAKLWEKKHLEKLTLEWGSSTAEDSEKISDVLEKLKPHTHLKHLQIKNYRGTKFPPWLGDQSFCKMESLRLENIEFCSFLPPLGQLPSLKELTIARMSNITNVGLEFYGEIGSLSKPFASLETLRFEEMSEWVQWIQLDAGEFSRLQQLEVIKCPNLIGDLPKMVPSLVGLNVEKCPGLEASVVRGIREVVLEECKGVQFETQGASSVEKLALEWDSTTKDSKNARDVLEKLEPHTNLKDLEIKNYGGTRFPTWLRDQSFFNMVSIHLENCENCFSLPPLGQMPSLKELTLARMPGITIVGHEFYGETGSLSKPFQSLETLRFEKMSGWVDWCILDAGEFSRLQKLEVIKCPKLIGDLPKKVPYLARLEIDECPQLGASLPSTTSVRQLLLKDCQGVQLEWQGVSSVEVLEISGFGSLKEFASELVTLTNLKELRVEKCPRLYVPLSEEMSHCYMSLERLELQYCQRLKSLPLGLFPELRSLTICHCINLETLLIPNRIELRNLTSLDKVSIFGCNNMLSFPCGGLPAPNLSSLSIFYCEKLKALPEQMHTLLPALQLLTLWDCPDIESFPGGLPSKLGALDIRNCKKLVGGRRNWGLQTLPSLTSFTLWGESEDVLESFPEEGLLPSTLTSLHFGRLPNLKSLNERGLQLLGYVERMFIINCPQLKSLPEERLPSSLLELRIWDCPLLKSRCRREEGEDWHKIDHIPLIVIDGEAITD